MRYFRVVNFERFQHYRDRRPVWIKLYSDLLENYDFACLQDASKLHQVLIWLLASRHNNRIPWDPEWVAKRINATDPVDLNVLQAAGFIEEIETEHLASKTLADRSGSACLETEKEKKEDPPPRSPPAKRKRKRVKTPAPREMAITEAMRTWAQEHAPHIDLVAETERFLDRNRSTGTQYVEWEGAWRNWMRKAVEFRRERETKAAETLPDGRPWWQGRYAQ